MCQHEHQPRNVDWKDLLPVDRAMTLSELTIPLPWLLGSWLLYSSPWPILGLIASFMFFLCALRLNHEAIHNNLGLPRWGDHWVMHGLSALMLGANNAQAYAHMMHHRHSGGPEDHEGKCSHMRWYQVLVYGPKFPIDVNIAAWRDGGRKWRRRMVIDWVCIVSVIGVFAIVGHAWMWMHLGAMVIAQSLAAFFAVWITHQGTGEHLAARSQRGIAAKAAYLMLYHREHHLFPKVPVSRLPELARRLDRDVPGYSDSRMPVAPWLEKLV
ncbi:MAG: fatty acid desaturase [Pseudomonadota bacterium]